MKVDASFVHDVENRRVTPSLGYETAPMAVTEKGKPPWPST